MCIWQPVKKKQQQQQQQSATKITNSNNKRFITNEVVDIVENLAKTTKNIFFLHTHVG